MSDLEEAFDDALDAAEEAKGERETVTFQGGPKDALVSEETVDLGPGSGGYLDKAPITVSVRTDDITLPIEGYPEITVRGRDLFVLSHQPVEGCVHLTCGDLAEE